jgi:hypothetical protein
MNEERIEQMTDNKREYFRFQCSTPLCGEFRIASINDIPMDTKMTYVCVKDISAGGVRFESNLQVPVRDDISVQIRLRLIGKEIMARGLLKYSKPVDQSAYFEYGLEFILSNHDENALVQMINETSIRMRKTGKLGGCELCSMERICYKSESVKEQQLAVMV